MILPHRKAMTILLTLGIASIGTVAAADDQPSAERGRYLVVITGCNDCHTAGYVQAAGNVPESEWLKGDSLGWHGPWGTTYSPNLRLTMAVRTEDEWVEFAHNLPVRPPMPSFIFNKMTESDVRSIYRFVRQLQPLGEQAPAFIPPGVEPPQPYVQFPEPPPAQ
jgi:mono/diheme cytochrome c family protein